MSTNPYESPTAVIERPTAMAPNRQRAQWSFRLALLILLLPALFNYYAFDNHAIGDSRISSPLQSVYRTTNVFGIVIASALIWFLGLPLLERAAKAARFLFLRNAPIDAWYDALYASLNPAVLLAIPGAILWAAWVTGFYYFGLDFVALSYGVGVPAHVIAACLYVPLFYRWYKLSQTGPDTPTPPNKRWNPSGESGGN